MAVWVSTQAEASTPLVQDVFETAIPLGHAVFVLHDHPPEGTENREQRTAHHLVAFLLARKHVGHRLFGLHERPAQKFALGAFVVDLLGLIADAIVKLENILRDRSQSLVLVRLGLEPLQHVGLPRVRAHGLDILVVGEGEDVEAREKRQQVHDV